MSYSRSERLRAGRALARLIGSPEGRELFRANGHKKNGAITVALESDRMSAVYARAIEDSPEPPATIAIFFPEDDRLELIKLAPTAMLADSTGASKAPKDLHDVHRDATIGAVFDYMRSADKPSVSMPVSNWYSAKPYVSPPKGDGQSLQGRRYTLV